MQKPNWAVALILLPASLAAASLLSACGSTSIAGASGNSTAGSARAPAQHLAVADDENNRVLIFDAPFATDESASVVLGQTDFTGQQQNEGGAAASNTLSTPSGLAVDAEGNLYVADFGNCRVLQFRPPFTTNMNASVVLGDTQVCGTGPGEMDWAMAVTMDAHGDLWVVEANRVVEYTPPFTSGMNPSVVLGQANDGVDACNGGGAAGPSGNPPPTAATLCNPVDAAFDSQGDLWVTDTLNARVVEYTPPFTTGMAATLALGVTGTLPFTTTGCVTGETSASELCFPQALAFDANGNLWVTTAFNGISEFAPPFSNGMAAKMVVAQPPPSDSDPPSAATTIVPDGIFPSGNGNLVVSDTGDNRVLMFAPPFGPGMQATTVIGQPDMTTGTDTSGAAANKLWYPVGVLTF